MHTWIRTDLLKDLESHFLRLNWPWFNGPLMRINSSMATLQLLGGDSERDRAPRELNTMALAGLRNKNVSISSPTHLPWGIPHRRRGRVIENQRKKNVILQHKPN